MLQRLEISGYGLIEHAEIDFATGATIFTGETGSGKTMVLGALTFVLGARGGAGKPRVTLTFDPDEALRARLAADGYEIDPDETASIVRETNDAGKSSVRVNGRPSTAAYLRDIGPRVAEIVGQHEAQRLLQPAYQSDLLDRFGGPKCARERAAVAAAFGTLSSIERELSSLHDDVRDANARYDEARYAIDDIESASLESGEDERLTERRRYLDNVERIAAALRTAHDALAADESSASSGLGAARVALGSVADVAADLAAMARAAGVLQDEAAELATRISRALDETEFDAGELESINARLELIDRLKRKYGSSIDAVMERGREARAYVAAFESRDERAIELEARRIHGERELTEAAANLTAARKESAAALRQGVEAEFKALALGSARFEVRFVPLERIGVLGAETAEFQFSANAGEPVKPLAKTASGGELSRVLLALVVVLAQVRERGALVFDEIDAGIGGATATAVGTRIGRLSKSEQVVCVTHLAQLATWASRHYVLDKHEKRGSTTITVREVSGDEPRAAELARMLSGESHDAALEHARTLLRTASR